MLNQPDAKPYLRAPVRLRVTPVKLFFDIEVDPLRDVCYLHGIVERHDRRNETEKFVYFFAEEAAEEAEREAFAAAYQPDDEVALCSIYLGGEGNDKDRRFAFD